MRVLGIDIGGTAVKGGWVEDFKVKKKTVILTDKVNPMKTVKSLINKYLATRKPSVIGIATGGRVNCKTGEVMFATPNLKQWTGLNLKEILQEEFKVPVFVINDSRAAALAEARFRNVDSLFMLTIGTGLGGGYVKGGKVLLGESWEAGEIGHTILYPNGRECNCGKKGCAEQYISMKVLHKYAGVKDRKELLKLFEKNSEKVIKALEIMANDLAILIDRIFLEFDPEFITLGGGFSELGDKALRIVRKKLRKFAEFSMYSVDRVVMSKLGNDAGMLGAAIFAEENLSNLM